MANRHRPCLQGRFVVSGPVAATPTAPTVIIMTTRCTRATLMYKGGQIDLATHAVWARTPQGPQRIKDALALRRFDGDVEILVTARQPGIEPARPDDSMFSEVPDGWIRRRTSYRRATGSGHLDKPLTDAERLERNELIQRTAKKLTASMTNGAARARVIADVQSELADLYLTHGTDRITEHLRSLDSTPNPSAVLRALRELPSLADEAGAPAAAFGVTHPSRPSPALVALQPSPGRSPARPVVIEASSAASVHPHAAARWMERVDGTVDAALVDAARDILRHRSSRAAAHAAALQLSTLLTERGLDAGYLAETRRRIAAALSTTAGASPVFSDRRVHDYGGSNDRALLRADVGGEMFEFLVRARAVRPAVAGGAVVLEVISMWPVASALTTLDPWTDATVAAEHREHWSLAVQEQLIATMSRITPTDHR